MPGADILMPLKAILSFSGLGANSRAVCLSDVAAFDELAQVLGEIHHAFLVEHLDGVVSLLSSPSEISFLMVGLTIMISLVGVRPTPLEALEQLLGDDAP